MIRRLQRVTAAAVNSLGHCVRMWLLAALFRQRVRPRAVFARVTSAIRQAATHSAHPTALVELVRERAAATTTATGLCSAWLTWGRPTVWPRRAPVVGAADPSPLLLPARFWQTVLATWQVPSLLFLATEVTRSLIRMLPSPVLRREYGVRQIAKVLSSTCF